MSKRDAMQNAQPPVNTEWYDLQRSLEHRQAVPGRAMCGTVGLCVPFTYLLNSVCFVATLPPGKIGRDYQPFIYPDIKYTSPRDEGPDYHNFCSNREHNRSADE